ncbi:MAG: protein kinase, partial [Myxococcales bacterium]|nr:protein kinase [Myxococcales bacterium]
EIVHRDVSPHNILLATSGAVKVIDFGIAKAQNRRQGQTRTGIVKGKVQYMAPEQVNKGASVDRRADVWALGMCLHELALGKLPYDGDDDVDVIRKLMGNEPPAIVAGAPEPIARILAQAMALDPDARFPTAAGLQRALEGAMKELGESVSSEDVAAFVRAELPDLAKRRREAVGRAIDDAKERGTPITESRDEVAFAPTLVGDRGARPSSADDARAIALTKRKGDAPRAPDDSKVTPSTALENEPITIPKRGRGLVWATLLAVGVGAGAVFVWHGVQGGGFPGSRGTEAPDPAAGAAAPPPAVALPPAPPRPSVGPSSRLGALGSPPGSIPQAVPGSSGSAGAGTAGSAGAAGTSGSHPGPLPNLAGPQPDGRTPGEAAGRRVPQDDRRASPALLGRPGVAPSTNLPLGEMPLPEPRVPSLAPSPSADPSATAAPAEDDPNNPYNDN